MSISFDETQITKIKLLLHKYWRHSTLGIAIIVIAATTWSIWQNNKQKNLTQAADIFSQILQIDEKISTSTINNVDTTDIKYIQNKQQLFTLARSIVTQYPDLFYAYAAQLLMAKYHTQDNELNQAAISLHWILEHKAEPEIAYITKIRLAKILWQQNKPQQALKMLENKTSKAFTPIYFSLKGDIYTALNQLDKAHNAYTQAAKNNTHNLLDNDTLQMKINNIPPLAEQDKNHVK